jgi:hypothetical protein
MNPEILPEEVSEIKNIPIVFVVGFGRSGTTLLQELLNASPNVVAPPNIALLPTCIPASGKKRIGLKKMFWILLKHYISGLFFRCG